MSRRVRAWLAARAGPVPPTLQAAMESAVDADLPSGTAWQEPDGPADRLDAPSHGPDELAPALASAALRVLVDAIDRGDNRAAALALLAADALVTAACEAATDPGVDTDTALNVLCATFAPDRLDGLLPEGSP